MFSPATGIRNCFYVNVPVVAVIIDILRFTDSVYFILADAHSYSCDSLILDLVRVYPFLLISSVASCVF